MLRIRPTRLASRGLQPGRAPMDKLLGGDLSLVQDVARLSPVAADTVQLTGGGGGVGPGYGGKDSFIAGTKAVARELACLDHCDGLLSFEKDSHSGSRHRAAAGRGTPPQAEAIPATREGLNLEDWAIPSEGEVGQSLKWMA